MYHYGARSVKCAVCSFVTSVGISSLFSTSLLLKLKCILTIAKKKKVKPNKNLYRLQTLYNVLFLVGMVLMICL